MRVNIVLATLSSFILVAQTYFLATLLDKLIIQNVPRDELIPYFLGLIIGLDACYYFLWAREKNRFPKRTIITQPYSSKNSG